MLHALDFSEGFRALTGGLDPFRWQTRVYRDWFSRGRVPALCSLPTGLGKTSVIVLWLLAIANGAPLPRRLVYVVNRRTVVDQATDSVTHLLTVIRRPGDAGQHADAAGRIRDALVARSGDPAQTPLAVSTLRGELADNGEWKQNPARPAVIVGTIDMIGSKLLFSGYGDGRHGRAHHAGLVGQDALIVHDEAHLSPAFDGVLRAVAAEQLRSGEPRPIRVMSLSATSRGAGTSDDDGRSVFDLSDEDSDDAAVRVRLAAAKRLRVVESAKGGMVDAIASEALSLGSTAARVLVYVRSPATAHEVRAEVVAGVQKQSKRLGVPLTLPEAHARVAVLTGTVRGHERDRLADSALFRAFQSSGRRTQPEHSLYLISTSAGEVGADWDADHLVTDVSTLDSMAQRFGRVNRLGGDGRSAQVVVVDEATGEGKGAARPYEAAVAATRDLLHRVAADGGDVSPDGMRRVLSRLSDEERGAAFSPAPRVLQATDIHFDHWSLTSIAGRLPGRPDIEPFLHGVAEWEPPETHVAWRADVALLAEAGGTDEEGNTRPCSPAELDAVFDAFPVQTTERLRDRSDRVQEHLAAIAERLSRSQQGTGDQAAGTTDPLGSARDGTDPYVVLIQGASARWVRLSELVPEGKQERERARQRLLAFSTVVLPVEVGGLKEGMLDGVEPAPADARSLDVAELPRQGLRPRHRVIVEGDGPTESPLVPRAGGSPTPRAITRHSVTLSAADGDAAARTIEYRLPAGDGHEPGERVALDAHNSAVSSAARRMAVALGLEARVVDVIVYAARLHDSGKARAAWQRYARNLPHRPTPGGPVAKSDGYLNAKALAGYRHELGSLHDAMTDPQVQSLASEHRDLLYHLIAAHHGWGRPHFEPHHFDRGDPASPRSTAENERAAVETVQRFARLQRRFGRWGLAWLESILRCADAEASAAMRPDHEVLGASAGAASPSLSAMVAGGAA